MFQKTSFGRVWFDNVEYDHDVWVGLDNKPRRRESVGSHHLLSREELEKYLSDDVEVVVFGTGQDGVARVSSDAEVLAREKGIQIISLPTPQAIEKYNDLCNQKKTIAVIHVTC